jgi:hypothetical protein
MKTRTLQALSVALLLAVATPTLASASTITADSSDMTSLRGGRRVAAQVQPWEQFRIRLIGLRCDDEQDNLPVDSDEPYALIGIIKGPANGNPPTYTFWHTDVYNGIDAGDIVLPNLDVLTGNAQGQVAIVTQVVESDGDALAVVLDTMADSTTAFDEAVDDGILDPLTLGGAVGNAFFNSVTATRDDPIGGPVRILLTPDRFDNLALGQSTTVVAQAQGNGGKYLAAYQLLRTR